LRYFTPNFALSSIYAPRLRREVFLSQGNNTTYAEIKKEPNKYLEAPNLRKLAPVISVKLFENATEETEKTAV
jgi:hypothetical protein